MNKRSADVIELARYRHRAEPWPCFEMTTTADGLVRLHADLETSRAKAMRILAILAEPT